MILELERRWLLTGPCSAEVAEVQMECHFASCFVPYYCPCHATYAFVLHLNLMVQASGQGGK